MFTSRAEYRLLLQSRQRRPAAHAEGREVGLVDDARWESYQARETAVHSEISPALVPPR